MTPFELSLLFFLQMAAILLACQVVGRAARWLGQPQVVGEMIAGVVLGPSLLGLFLPDWQQALFPKPALAVLFVVSQLGLALYMFLVGIEFRTELFRTHARGAAAVSVAGMLTPFALGAALALWLVRQDGLFGSDTQPGVAALFLGAAMSITAFPMLARIIYERGLAGSALGTLCLAAGAIDDASAWCVLAIVLASFHSDWWTAVWAIGGGCAYFGVVLVVVRPLALYVHRHVERVGELSPAILAMILATVMLGAWFTDMIGIYAVFGAFLLGAVVPRGRLADELQRKLEPVIVTLLLPLFFTYSGLNTRLDLLNSWQLWGWTLIVLAAAVLGKGVACWGAARAMGADQRTALATGALMNSRGLMELIALNIGLQQGVITERLFSIMVVMAIVTTLMTAPVFELVYGRWARAQGLLAQRA